MNSIKIEINSSVVNNRDIVFEYEIGCKNSTEVVNGEIVLTIQNGVEFSGIRTGHVHLTTDKYYIITGNVVFDSLTIDPGTILRLNDEAALFISSYLKADGTPEQPILFTHNNLGYWNNIKRVGGDPMNFSYCIFEYGQGSSFSGENLLTGATKVEDCIFRYNKNQIFKYSTAIISNCTFKNNDAYYLSWGVEGAFENNTIVDNDTKYDPPLVASSPDYLNKLRNNVIFNNMQSGYNTTFNTGVSNPYWGIFHFPPNYYGTTDSVEIEHSIQDFFENSYYPVIMGDSALNTPPATCHGCVWKVEINGQNPQEKVIDPIGVGLVKFDLYFNRAMDTSITPFFTFGVRNPFTQNIIVDNSSWSNDSTVYTAYYTVGLETGDGINTIRVANAKDNEFFDVPIEYTRFKFIIQAAGAASAEFQATPGIGKVNVEWPFAYTDDVLGYNMYRFSNITDTTFSDTIRINTSLITDSVYVDYEVIPDTTYYYQYKVLGTDMVESDFSNTISALPFDAANGDANGDLTVNILDIITIVDYILMNDPQPFLFDASDFNGDGAIDVLDIIAVVNEISGKKSSYAINSNGEATFSINNQKIFINSDVEIGAYQFIIEGDVENLSISSLLPMEMITKQLSENELMVISFSLNQTTIPDGYNPVLSILKENSLLVKDLIVSDINGGFVNARFETGATEVNNNSTAQCFSLGQNYPNPFSNSTYINYSIPKTTEVTFCIYNISGQEIYSINKKETKPGNYNFIWNGTNNDGVKQQSGIYFYELKTSEYYQSRKMFFKR